MKDSKILYVVPECYVDTNLIEYLLHAKVNHQHGCSKVVHVLTNTFEDKFAIGIIDRDKVVLGYIHECTEIAHTEHLALLKHHNYPQYLITIAPAVDQFILDAAIEQTIDPQTYQLPSELKEFIKVSKSVTSNTDQRFRDLFAAINSNHEIQTLQKSLAYLVKAKYDAKTEQLQSFFA